ncbi:MAG: hypothetical protein ABF893_06355 [Gluconacetobacter liquefaciens]
MSWRADRRRRQIRAKGRSMTLSRPRNGGSVTLTAYAPPPQASQLSDGVARAAFIAQITADETGSAGFIPQEGDNLVDGSCTYTLTDAAGVYDGPTLIGWTLIAAGGS